MFVENEDQRRRGYVNTRDKPPTLKCYSGIIAYKHDPLPACKKDILTRTPALQGCSLVQGALSTGSTRNTTPKGSTALPIVSRNQALSQLFAPRYPFTNYTPRDCTSSPGGKPAKPSYLTGGAVNQVLARSQGRLPAAEGLHLHLPHEHLCILKHESPTPGIKSTLQRAHELPRRAHATTTAIQAAWGGVDRT